MPQRLTIFTIPGNPDELFKFKHAVMDPVITAKGAQYGELLHVAVRNPDGSGITIVNLWDSAEGSDRAAQDPKYKLSGQRWPHSSNTTRHRPGCITRWWTSYSGDAPCLGSGHFAHPRGT